MSQGTNGQVLRGRLRLFVIGVLLAAAFASTPARAAQSARSADSSDLLQFTAAGHVLGFRAEGVYVAAGDHMLRVEFAGTPGVAPVSEQTPSGKEQVQSLARVTYPDLWPGISLSYEPVAGGIMQSSYRLETGADVGQIRLRYNAHLEIEAGGGLRIQYDTADMRESAPVAWQDINGRRIPVEVGFRALNSAGGSYLAGFSLGHYDPAHPVMIDPVLRWNTFMGSSSSDGAWAIAVDGSGDVYVAGLSGATWGSPVNPHAGNSDAFAAKLDSTGTLQWNTFLGSGGMDYAFGIALDGSGSVYVAGDSAATWGSPVNAHAGGNDAFIAKLSSSGALQWNTFMGSSDYDQCRGIAVDESGDVYVAGDSAATWGSPLNPHAGDSDAFAAKLNSGGTLQWNTFMGSAGYDSSYGIAVDGSGAVYVAGSSNATWGSPVSPYAGGGDAFAAKLSSGGSLQWNTFMGSAGYFDVGYGIAVDASGGVYLTGNSDTTWGSPANPHAGGTDVFAAQLNSNGNLQWNTFMGSVDYDLGSGIAVDDNENAYVTGYSRDTWGSPVNAYAGNNDAFLAQLGPGGALQLNTFMGSVSEDFGRAVAADSYQKVYVAGYSYATWGSPVNAHAGDLDAFAVKLVPSTREAPTTTPSALTLCLLVLVGSAVWLIRRRVLCPSA